MKILSFVSRGLFVLSAYVCLPAILLLLSVDVVLRYFFNAPLQWAQEAATLALFLTIVFALPESWLKDAHIKADFFTLMVGRMVNEVLARLIWLLILASSAIIAFQSCQDIELMTLFNERSSELGLPLSWFRVVLAASSIVCALIAAWKLLSPRPAASPTHGEML